MSRQPQAVYVVPEDTARVAGAAFPKGKPDLRMHDELGRLDADQDFATLFPVLGQPALAPAQLALVTLLQFAEHLTDRQAVEAVHARIDWEYALCLELHDPGFDFSALREFRARLLAAVLAAIRRRDRLELVDEILRHVPHTPAAVVPDWPRQACPAAWAGRYGRRREDYRRPRAAPARQALAARIGAEGHQPLQAVDAPDAPAWLRAVPAVEMLRHAPRGHPGCSSTTPPTTRGPWRGAARATSRPVRCASTRRTTPRPASAPSGRPAGRATRSTSRGPVTRTAPIASSPCRRRPRRRRTTASSRRSTPPWRRPICSRRSTSSTRATWTPTTC